MLQSLNSTELQELLTDIKEFTDLEADPTALEYWHCISEIAQESLKPKAKTDSKRWQV